MTHWLSRPRGGLRLRLAVLLGAALFVLGVSIYGTLMTLTRQWLREELQARARSLAVQMASRVATPLVVRDALAINTELRELEREEDIVGVVVYDARGERFAGRAAAGEAAPLERVAPGTPSLRERDGAIHAIAAIVREASVQDAPLAEARELIAEDPPPTSARREPVGWLVLSVSTARVESSLATAMRLGLLVLLTVLGVAAIPIAFVVRATLVPLSEASDLARDIAAGELHRRLPVRTGDEIGALAESMNTMAEALQGARAEARNEADALRVAFEAVGAIARGARRAPDAAAMFRVVASELRRVTGCDGIALAAAGDEDETLRFHHFDPPLPWGELRPGMSLDATLARRLLAAVESPVRLDVDHEPGPLVRGLARHGLRSVLVVPLVVEGGPRGALLLVARRLDAFPPAQIEMVAGLANHLGAALDAAALRARLERAFEELQTARAHLVRSERQRVAGEMASGVAHEFNNVLGAILGRAQLLQRRATGGGLETAELIRSLRVMERAALDGGETVRRLRQFGTPGDGTAAETVDLADVVLEAAEITRTRWENEAQAEGRQIALHTDVERGAWVAGRGSELREVFVNLFLNAVDAMPGGGTIRLHVSHDDERVHAWVEDSGEGMSEDVRRRIFDPFFTTKGDRGTGLGLSVASAIVRRHQGEMIVFSEVGYGTRMELSFPRAAAAAATTEAPAAEAGEVPPLDVLVVDDEGAVRDLLADIVEALGHTSVRCASGAEALVAFDAQRFDLVLSDIGMPGMTGWELARALRDRDPGLTLAFVTGWGEEITPETAREAGGDLVVPKPFTLDQIANVLTLAHDRRGARRRAA